MNKYLKHFNNNTKIPKTSKWRLKKQKRLDALGRNLELAARSNSQIKNFSSTNISDEQDCGIAKNQETRDIFNSTNIVDEENFYDYDESNPNFHEENIHEPLEELQRIQIDSTDKLYSEEHKKELIHAALLALFFSGNFTQESFKLVLEFTKLFTDIKIPSSFNQLIKSIGENQIEYIKTWVCHNCQLQVELTSTSQRTCSFCNNQ